MTCHAWIHVERQQRIACIVRNLSPRGALLEFAERAPYASRFRLLIEPPLFEAQCDVRHRTANALGVYFEETGDHAIEPPKVDARRLVAEMRLRLGAGH